MVEKKTNHYDPKDTFELFLGLCPIEHSFRFRFYLTISHCSSSFLVFDSKHVLLFAQHLRKIARSHFERFDSFFSIFKSACAAHGNFFEFFSIWLTFFFHELK